MIYSINITFKAERDVIEACDYVEYTLKNPIAADKLLNSIQTQLESLIEMPNRFRVIDDPVLSHWGIRFILINNYIAFFTIDEETKTINIIRFLYKKRDWLSILKNE